MEFNRQRDETWRSMTPEERYKAGLQKHAPHKRGGRRKKPAANLEGDIVVPIGKKRGRRPKNFMDLIPQSG